MAGSEMLDLGVKIDKLVIEENVTRLVAAAIVEALGNKEQLVHDAVTEIIGTYVDKNDGKQKRKGDYNAIPWLNYITEKVVRESVKSEMERIISENADEFKNALKKEMSKPKIRELFAAQFIESVLKAAKSEWKMPVTVSFEQPKDY